MVHFKLGRHSANTKINTGTIHVYEANIVLIIVHLLAVVISFSLVVYLHNISRKFFIAFKVLSSHTLYMQ